MNGSTTLLNKTRLVRLILAALILIADRILGFSGSLEFIMLILSVLLAGADIIKEAIVSAMNDDLRLDLLIVLFVTIVSFITPYRMETSLMVLAFALSDIAVSYIKKAVNDTSLNLISSREVEAKNQIIKVLKNPKTLNGFSRECMLRTSLQLYPLICTGIAIVMLILLAVIENYSILVALHRALMIFLIASPAPLFIAMKSVSFTGLCYSADNGVVFKDIESLDHMDAEGVLLDHTGYFLRAKPRVLEVECVDIDKNTFINFVVHMVCKSSQKFAKIIIDQYNLTYNPEIVSNFHDYDGFGVSGSINNLPVYFGNADYIDSLGMAVPEENNTYGCNYYLYLSGRYIGRMLITFSEEESRAEISKSFIGIIRNRIVNIDTENVLIAFIVKAFLIFLSILGLNKLWVIVLVETIFEVLTIINSLRVKGVEAIKQLRLIPIINKKTTDLC